MATNKKKVTPATTSFGAMTKDERRDYNKYSPLYQRSISDILDAYAEATGKSLKRGAFEDSLSMYE